MRNVVADIAMISTTDTIWMWMLPSAFMNVPDSGAPKIVALSNDVGELLRHRPERSASSPAAISGSEFSTRNSAKKMGDWSRIGRHEANGLVPCLR